MNTDGMLGVCNGPSQILFMSYDLPEVMSGVNGGAKMCTYGGMKVYS